MFQNSKSKKCSCSKDQKRRCSRGFAPVAMALYNQGSGIPVLPMNRRYPRPHRGQGWRKGGGGRSVQQEINRQNITIPLFYHLIQGNLQNPKITPDYFRRNVDRSTMGGRSAVFWPADARTFSSTNIGTSARSARAMPSLGRQSRYSL